MSLHTNAGFNLEQIAEDAKAARELHIFQAMNEDADRRATIDAKGWLSGGLPEVLAADSQALARREWSFDDSSGKAARERAQIHAAKRFGKLQPKAFVDRGDHVEYVFDSDAPIEAMAQKIFCIRCREKQPEEAHIALEGHHRIRDAVPYHYEIPKTPLDNCCYCGAVLGGSQKVA